MRIRSGILGALKGVVVIDEVQKLPQLLPTLRVLADREDAPAKFVVFLFWLLWGVAECSAQGADKKWGPTRNGVHAL